MGQKLYIFKALQNLGLTSIDQHVTSHKNHTKCQKEIIDKKNAGQISIDPLAMWLILPISMLDDLYHSSITPPLCLSKFCLLEPVALIDLLISG